jgi:hypothetical protein
MRELLRLHPDFVCPAVSRIVVDVERSRAGTLLLRYVVTGSIAQLRVPPVTVSACADGLWQHTCFEAFIRAGAASAYYEFNFAPSTQWAAYRFAGYRNGMQALTEIAPPVIETRSDAECCAVEAFVELAPLSDLPREADWQLGLCAVIEEAGGRKSYWALAHPPGKPDFHHPDCFASEISPA